MGAASFGSRSGDDRLGLAASFFAFFFAGFAVFAFGFVFVFGFALLAFVLLGFFADAAFFLGAMCEV
jgi:hypothetical protein